MNVYINPPYSKLLVVLLHFLRCKLRAPVGTAVLLILPVWVGEAYWDLVCALPRTFRVVRRWDTGSALFTSPDGPMAQRKYCGPTRWPAVALRVDAHPSPDALAAVIAEFELRVV